MNLIDQDITSISYLYDFLENILLNEFHAKIKENINPHLSYFDSNKWVHDAFAVLADAEAAMKSIKYITTIKLDFQIKFKKENQSNITKLLKEISFFNKKLDEYMINLKSISNVVFSVDIADPESLQNKYILDKSFNSYMSIVQKHQLFFQNLAGSFKEVQKDQAFFQKWMEEYYISFKSSLVTSYDNLKIKIKNINKFLVKFIPVQEQSNYFKLKNDEILESCFCESFSSMVNDFRAYIFKEAIDTSKALVFAGTIKNNFSSFLNSGLLSTKHLNSLNYFNNSFELYAQIRLQLESSLRCLNEIIGEKLTTIDFAKDSRLSHLVVNMNKYFESEKLFLMMHKNRDKMLMAKDLSNSYFREFWTKHKEGSIVSTIYFRHKTPTPENFSHDIEDYNISLIKFYLGMIVWSKEEYERKSCISNAIKCISRLPIKDQEKSTDYHKIISKLWNNIQFSKKKINNVYLIDMLVDQTYKPHHENDPSLDARNNCSICLIESKTHISIGCPGKHEFHGYCLAKWVCQQQAAICPNCRYETKIQIQSIALSIEYNRALFLQINLSILKQTLRCCIIIFFQIMLLNFYFNFFSKQINNQTRIFFCYQYCMKFQFQT